MYDLIEDKKLNLKKNSFTFTIKPLDIIILKLWLGELKC